METLKMLDSLAFIARLVARWSGYTLLLFATFFFFFR